MNSREKILEAISKNKPALQPFPEIVIDTECNYSVLLQQFVLTLDSIGAIVIIAENIQTIKDDLQKDIANGEYIVNTIEALGIVNKEVNIKSDAVFLEPVVKAYISGTLGVAENGAVWLEESKMINRLLPFICQHLILVIDTNKIVANMHEAYRQIPLDKEGYGIFLAGPSKTADIEQSLVIGAHGARSLKVYLLGV